ncbi:glyoxylase-like metal-dependent hydrolase (beta-lactamase superfamily II) [Pseudoduganella flava]|uniref:Glyoxylase-like metal-dependent hydrolase (Beta-lactamase superfamily II) n=1 Tax=Pseudoduganella flava TaxID=871742 RepID=A0A562PH32_9BURK|nr:MBL fold metallo-hydrolase [Pseudoduganella flava]QGZ42592.1 MBL fold metallo-hydrolase [Pseudoduganella flava]TWI43747.1 glyoxylase-like metal-dependent hydrolase (beta-lactamase superfamily II) [Pseudoduganella flava]
MPSSILSRSLIGLALCGALAAATVAQVHAAAPFAAAQAPGWYRIAVGRYEVTALLDGTHPFPAHDVLTRGPASLDTTDPGLTDRLLAASYLKAPVEGSINAFLVNTGKKLILIDSGAGALYGADGGHLLGNLRAAGYTPEQVDEVLLTHLHADHVGGVALGTAAAFPNALVRVNRRDAVYWLSSTERAQAPAFLRGMFDGAQASLKPYLDTGRFKPFDREGQLEEGIAAAPSPGHTPGHTTYLVESDGERLRVWGDTVHVAAVQFADPGVTVKYDSDAGEAAEHRRALFADMAQRGDCVAAAHVAFPGLGHVRQGPDGYRWVPVNYVSREGAPHVCGRG